MHRCACGNRTPNGRNLCHGCRKAEWRRKYPYHAAYCELRWSAQRRGIEFSLTLEEFTEFAKRSRYIQRKGNESHSLTVDRIDNLRGYVSGNIQPMTRAENVRKMIRFDEARKREAYGKRLKGWKYETPPDLLEELHQAIAEDGNSRS